MQTCQCVLDPEQTKVVQPCLMHAIYARSVAMGEFAARVEAAEAPKGTKGPRANLKTPWEAPR